MEKSITEVGSKEHKNKIKICAYAILKQVSCCDELS